MDRDIIRRAIDFLNKYFCTLEELDHNWHDSIPESEADPDVIRFLKQFDGIPIWKLLPSDFPEHHPMTEDYYESPALIVDGNRLSFHWELDTVLENHLDGIHPINLK